MSFLNKYKVGSPLFRILSETRMRMNILCNAIRYSHPPPKTIIGIHDYLAEHGNSCRCETLPKPPTFQFPKTYVEPAIARPLLEKHDQIEFPEPFVLRTPKGSVLGDGTVIVNGNTILSDTTTDFHRKQEYHHLLSERKIPEPKPFDGRLAVISAPGSKNYFHWTLDAVPRFGLLKNMAGEIDAYYVDNSNRFHREWLDKLGIPSSKIVSASSESHIQPTELIVPSFAGLPGLPSPEGLEFLRKLMPQGKLNEQRRVYVSRSQSRRRRIVNERKILSILHDHGFTVVHPGRMSVVEQMELFGSAGVIVAAHGAELTNLAYCAPGTRIVELFSPYYINPCFANLAALCGLQYTALIGKGGARVLRKGRDTHFVWNNLRVNGDLLIKTLGKMNEQ